MFHIVEVSVKGLGAGVDADRAVEPIGKRLTSDRAAQDAAEATAGAVRRTWIPETRGGEGAMLEGQSSPARSRPD
jgi:hypothetical protein